MQISQSELKSQNYPLFKHRFWKRAKNCSWVTTYVSYKLHYNDLICYHELTITAFDILFLII